MPRSLYAPRLSDDVVRLLHREGQRRRIPMTRLADDLLRQPLEQITPDTPVLHLCEDEPGVIPNRQTGAA